MAILSHCYPAHLLEKQGAYQERSVRAVYISVHCIIYLLIRLAASGADILLTKGVFTVAPHYSPEREIRPVSDLEPSPWVTKLSTREGSRSLVGSPKRARPLREDAWSEMIRSPFNVPKVGILSTCTCIVRTRIHLLMDHSYKSGRKTLRTLKSLFGLPNPTRILGFISPSFS